MKKVKVHIVDNDPTDINNTFLSLYGDFFAEREYDDYLMTERGKAEYLYSIVMGLCKVEDFDADFLGEVAMSWKKHRSEFIFPQWYIKKLEEDAKRLNIY